MLKLYGFDPETRVVLIPSASICDWVETVTKRKLPTNHASAFLKSLGIPNLRKSDRQGSRNWLWTGESARANQEPVNLFDGHKNPPGSDGSDGGSGDSE
jgi:hypothetical protein